MKIYDQLLVIKMNNSQIYFIFLIFKHAVATELNNTNNGVINANKESQ